MYCYCACLFSLLGVWPRADVSAPKPLQSPARSLRSLPTDPHFIAALAAGVIVWALLAAIDGIAGVGALPKRDLVRYLLVVLAYPFVEELCFRGWMQPVLAERMQHRRAGVVSVANLLTSAAFALLHLINHPPLAAIATFVPSLVFGHFQERYRRILPCVVLHAFYNAGYFALFAT